MPSRVGGPGCGVRVWGKGLWLGIRGLGLGLLAIA